MTEASANSWVLGCGDIGQRLAALLIAQNQRVCGWVRSEATATQLEAAGIQARVVDLDAAMAPLHAAPRWLFWFAPPPNHGTTDPRIAGFLAALQTPPQRLIYLSTSAVYGDCGGAWIDEDAPLRPGNDRGRRRLDAEGHARAYATASGCDVLILRVPGIYGPDRIPEARLRAGTPILRADEAPFSNRIHADDLAAAALVVAERGVPGCAYNVSDGAPTTMTDYFQRCATHLGLPSPPQISLQDAQRSLTASMMSFLEESKRLRCDRLRTLGWSPRYTSIENGLALRAVRS